MKKGQEVKVIGGTYAGRVAVFDKVNERRPGKCFVFFKGANRNGAQVNITDVVPA